MVAEEPEKEAIIICIDKSQYMNHLDNEYSYFLQLNCVRSYCRAKLKSNPKNVIGLVAMGGKLQSFEPTSDLDKIFCQINYSLADRCVLGGELNFITALSTSRLKLSKYPYNRFLKRIIFFVGGPICQLLIEHAEAFGKGLKKDGIAVDVVNFFPKERKDGYWASLLETFVAAANNNNNCHIKHIQPHASTLSTDVLSRNSEILPGASLTEEEIRRLETKTPTTSKTVVVEQPGKHNELDNISTVTNSAIIGSVTSEINVKEVKGKKTQVAAAYDDDDDDDDDDDIDYDDDDDDDDDIDLDDDKYDIDDDDDDDDVEGEQGNEKAKKVGKGMWLMLAVVCYLFIYSLG